MSKKRNHHNYSKIETPKQVEADITKIRNEIKSELEAGAVANGLQGAILGAGIPGGANFGGPGTQGVSQANELFANLRWYFVSNFRQVLSQAYCEIGLIQTIVDVPVDDGLRGGVEIKSKQISADQIKQLQDVMERNGDYGKVAQGLKWTRLFGGGAVVINTDQDPSTPLDINKINQQSKLEFTAVDMWELYYDLQGDSGYNNAIQDEKYEYYSYYGVKLHKSRVMRMKGKTAPSLLRPRLRGWGFSVVESLIRSLNQYLEGSSLIYELMDEAKIDVFGIKNLTNLLLSPNGTQLVAKRIQLANQQKNYQHALVMDSEDKYEQKTLTFSGLAEVMKEIRVQVASDLRMPLTKVFGLSASGFNSGEDDIEVYNSMIESTIRSTAKIDILNVIELRCRKLFGFIPSDLSIEFKPLRILNTEQEEEVKTKKYERLAQAFSVGAISLEEFRAACNKNLLLDINLEESALPPGADEVPGADSGDDDKEPAKPKA